MSFEDSTDRVTRRSRKQGPNRDDPSSEGIEDPMGRERDGDRCDTKSLPLYPLSPLILWTYFQLSQWVLLYGDPSLTSREFPSLRSGRKEEERRSFT